MERRCWRVSPARSPLCCALAALAALVALPAFPSLAATQVSLGTGVRASAVDAPGLARWRTSQTLASALRVDRRWLAFASDGVVRRDERGTWRGAGSLETAVLSAGPLGARLALVGSLGEPARDATLEPSRAAAGARLSRRIGAWGGWFAADAGRATHGDRPPVAELTSGAWRQLGTALLSVSLTSRGGPVRGPYASPPHATVPADSARDSLDAAVTRPRQDATGDSVTALVARRWSEAEGRLFWAGGRWTLDVAVGGRLPAAGVRAAMWATVDGAWLVSPRLALVGGVGAAPSGLASRIVPHRHASIGLRLMRGVPLATPLPVELQPVAVGFEVRELGAGVYRVAVRVPRARIVEVTGDFTAWRPVALHRGSADWWEVTLPLTPGTHQVNVRINGERWVAPPGATVIDDDFAGVVGVIVVR